MTRHQDIRAIRGLSGRRSALTHGSHVQVNVHDITMQWKSNMWRSWQEIFTHTTLHWLINYNTHTQTQLSDSVYYNYKYSTHTHTLSHTSWWLLTTSDMKVLHYRAVDWLIDRLIIGVYIQGDDQTHREVCRETQSLITALLFWTDPRASQTAWYQLL